MKRVLVIGSGGAGKSTFATRLGAGTGLTAARSTAGWPGATRWCSSTCRALCLWRVLRRVLRRALRYVGRSRPDMAPGCPEQLWWEFLKWIWTYPHERRPGVLRKLGAIAGEKRVIVLRSPREVERFLRGTCRAGRAASRPLGVHTSRGLDSGSTDPRIRRSAIQTRGESLGEES